MKLLINAPNIHSGGAAILLNLFIQDANLAKYSDVLLVVDARYQSTDVNQSALRVEYVKPTILGRLWNEVKLCFFRGDIFCFGNLPPLLTRSKNVVVFMHNALYFEPALWPSFPLKTRLRLMIESFLFHLTIHSASKFLVQTPHMKRQLSKLSVDPERIIVAPFANIAALNRSLGADKSFICISSGDSHKNIKNLILAWEILSQENIYPPLLLTLSKEQYPSLVGWIELKIQDRQLQIQNLGSLDHSEIAKVYKSGSALIFPSLVESLGLPLIEAREANIDIIAPELDYVRDVVCPVETFDPLSPISIARAVKRYLGTPEMPIELVSASNIMQKIFD